MFQTAAAVRTVITYQVWRSWNRLFGCTTEHGPRSEEYTRLLIEIAPLSSFTLHEDLQLAGLTAR